MKKKRFIIFIGMIVALVVALVYDFTIGSSQKAETIARPNKGEGEKTVSLEVDADGLLEEYPYDFVVEEQVPTQAEIEEYFELAKKEILESVFDGQPAEHVEKNLKLKSLYANNMVEAEWNFDPPQYIDENGELFGDFIPNEGVLVNAEIGLKCAKNKEILTFSFKIFAPERSENEQFLDKVSQKLHTELQKEGETVELPKEIDGISIRWKTPREHIALKLLFIELMFCIGVFVHRREKKKEAKKKKESALKADYAQIVANTAILIGSGMTIKQSWNKISARYTIKRQENQIKQRPGYELILECCQKIKSGEAERNVYLNIGEIARIPEYRRLSRLLVQNFEKGNSGIAPLLEVESESAFEERKRMAMKLGEEAGTKMLFPMIAMLVMIMVIILVPAMANFM